MLETKIEILWNGKRPVEEMQETIELVRAILENRANNNLLTYVIHTPIPTGLNKYRAG